MSDIQNVFVTWGHALRLLASMDAAELLRLKNQACPVHFRAALRATVCSDA